MKTKKLPRQLAAALLAAVLTACAGASPRALVSAPRDDRPRERPTNVILFIGDGMGFGQLLVARMSLGALAMESMPVTGIVHTSPAHGLVTDSAAGATALATGKKTKIGMLGVTPDGAPVRSIFEETREAGGAIGFVSSGHLVGATAGAFLTHVRSREDRKEISRQIAESGADVLAGASEGFDALEEAARRGFAIARGAELLGIERAPVLALLDGLDGELPASGSAGITLAEATKKAIALLDQTGRRYLLVVEEDGIDTSAHEHDAAKTTAQVAVLDRAVAAALEIARIDRRTLVLVTADHETGGLHVTGGTSAKDAVLAWATGDHSGSPVPIFAFGPGADEFTGVLDNTQVHARLRSLLLDSR